jgi:hypothetical protein
MAVFYRGEDAFITHEVFEARSPDLRSFLIRELTGVHVVHDTHDALFPRAAMIGIGAILLGIAVVKGSIAGLSMWTVLALAAVLSSTISLGCVRNIRTYELRAVYRGRVVCLFKTRDTRVLGQVVRALRRAAEWNLDRR